MGGANKSLMNKFSTMKKRNTLYLFGDYTAYNYKDKCFTSAQSG